MSGVVKEPNWSVKEHGLRACALANVPTATKHGSDQSGIPDLKGSLG